VAIFEPSTFSIHSLDIAGASLNATHVVRDDITTILRHNCDTTATFNGASLKNGLAVVITLTIMASGARDAAQWR